MRPAPPDACWEPHRAGVTDGADGFTLVELLVTISLLAIGIVGVMQVLLGAMQVSASTDARARATAIATADVDALRGVPYRALGLAPSAPGFRATFEGAATVVLSEVQAATTPLGDAVEHAGETFAVRRDVVWSDATIQGADPYDDVLKRVVVTVTWQERSGTRTVRHETTVYPGGLGPHVGSSTTTVPPSGPSAPTCQSAVPGAADPTTQIELQWSPNGVPEAWEIERSVDGGGTWVIETDTLPGAQTSYVSVGLTPGSSYRFRLRAIVGADRSAWASCPAAQTAFAGTQCQLVRAMLVPGAAKRAPTGGLQRDVVVTVVTSGDCPATNVYRARYETSPGVEVDAPMVPGAGEHTLHIAGGGDTVWSLGVHVIDITRNGDVVASVTLRVNR